MKFLNKYKKGQALPLNTIVIAILVIIVLLVIVVFFTTQVGQTGEQLDENSPSICGPNNPALSTLKYTGFKSVEQYEGLSDTQKKDYSKAIGVSDCYVSTKDKFTDWQKSSK